MKKELSVFFYPAANQQQKKKKKKALGKKKKKLKNESIATVRGGSITISENFYLFIYLLLLLLLFLFFRFWYLSLITTPRETPVGISYHSPPSVPALLCYVTGKSVVGDAVTPLIYMR